MPMSNLTFKLNVSIPSWHLQADEPYFPESENYTLFNSNENK